jgi:hypothetical protein
MSTAVIPFAQRGVQRPLAAPGEPARLDRRADSEDAEPRFASIVLSDTAEILKRMPAQAATPAMVELLEVLSSPILLITDSPKGQFRETPREVPREIPPSRRALAA